VLRTSNNNKSKAVLSLVADNKWLVSGIQRELLLVCDSFAIVSHFFVVPFSLGTPVNTSLSDLENQFRFLGLEETEEMMSIYRKSTFHHVHDKSKAQETLRVPELGHFSFLMRSIMMRHSQKQEYIGTSTTLMSLPPKVRYWYA